MPSTWNERMSPRRERSFFGGAESALTISPAELCENDRRNALTRVPRPAVGVCLRGDASSDLWAVRGYQSLRNHGASVHSAADGSLFGHWVVQNPFDPSKEADAARRAMVELGIVYRQFGARPPMRLMVGAHLALLKVVGSSVAGEALAISDSLCGMAFDHGAIAVASQALCDVMTEPASVRPLGKAPMLDRGVPVTACELLFGPRPAH